jgi:hypothetical protein
MTISFVEFLQLNVGGSTIHEIESLIEKPIDDLLVDSFHWFHHSLRRVSIPD